MGTAGEFYIYKETMKGNQLNIKYSVQPNKIFETILQGEGHMTYPLPPPDSPIHTQQSYSRLSDSG